MLGEIISVLIKPMLVNSLKQASAFPPNFIHSLDATHMMLSALECQASFVAFSAGLYPTDVSTAARIDVRSCSRLVLDACFEHRPDVCDHPRYFHCTTSI